MSNETDYRAAGDLAEILADVAGRPLTAEESARCHQHVARFNETFDAARRAEASDDAFPFEATAPTKND